MTAKLHRFPSPITAQLRASSAVMLWRDVTRIAERAEKLTGSAQYAALLNLLDAVKRYGAAKGDT